MEDYFNTRDGYYEYIIMPFRLCNTPAVFQSYTFKLKTRIYFKKTDVNSFIGFDSYHYKTWITNIPKGQLRRIQRNCTDQSDFVKQAKMVKERFLERKYNEKLLDEAIKNVTENPEKKPLKKSEEGIVVPFITVFFKEALIMKKAIQTNWHL